VNRSGQEIGAEHASMVRTYLEGLWERQEPLPRRGGRPNLTSLAAACGFDRGVFYSNEAVATLLAEHDERDRVRFYDKLEQAELKREKADASAKHDRAIIERIVQLEAVVISQARELERFRRLEKLMCRDGILPP
jgi:hypothetical protein